MIYSFFVISLLRRFLFSFSLLLSFSDGCSAGATHLAILVHHAVNASVTHGFAVVNMLRSETAILAKNQFNAEKYHADSNY
jgi:hypothetical protein